MAPADRAQVAQVLAVPGHPAIAAPQLGVKTGDQGRAAANAREPPERPEVPGNPTTDPGIDGWVTDAPGNLGVGADEAAISAAATAGPPSHPGPDWLARRTSLPSLKVSIPSHCIAGCARSFAGCRKIWLRSSLLTW